MTTEYSTEKVTELIARSGYVDGLWGKDEIFNHMLALTRALEAEYTPTGHHVDHHDDEREAQGWREANAYARGDMDAQDDFMTGWRTADRLRRTVQGEPSDTEVRAALSAWLRAKTRGIPDTNINAMRAALRAAAAVREEGQGHG